MKPQDKILDIVREKGSDLLREDLFEINMLLTEVPFDQHYEVMGWVYEGIARIASDPLYDGDIELSDLEDADD